MQSDPVGLGPKVLLQAASLLREHAEQKEPSAEDFSTRGHTTVSHELLQQASVSYFERDR